MISLQSEYLRVLKVCNSLIAQEGVPSRLIYEALEIICEVYRISGAEFLAVRSQYLPETNMALKSLKEYAASVDNWKVKDCPFGLRDQCVILSFFLGGQKQDFKSMSGNFQSPQQIHKVLEAWKDLKIIC